jgi:integrase-like protein
VRPVAAVHETNAAGPPKPRLFDRVREAVRARHYSRRSEKAYVHWIKRYIFFHAKRHPVEMGAAEVTAFLTSLAVDNKVSLIALYRTMPRYNEVQEGSR